MVFSLRSVTSDKEAKMLNTDHIRLMIEEGNLEGAEGALNAHPWLGTPWIREQLQKKHSPPAPSKPKDGAHFLYRTHVLFCGILQWRTSGEVGRTNALKVHSHLP